MVRVIANRRAVQEYLASILQAGEILCSAFRHMGYEKYVGEA